MCVLEFWEFFFFLEEEEGRGLFFCKGGRGRSVFFRSFLLFCVFFFCFSSGSRVFLRVRGFFSGFECFFFGFECFLEVFWRLLEAFGGFWGFRVVGEKNKRKRKKEKIQRKIGAKIDVSWNWLKTGVAESALRDGSSSVVG